jgi:ubiquinone/menaquinone biosynthesis C-methylase UbiE
MTDSIPDQREEMLERWERAAAGWSRRADSVQEFGMRVSVWIVEHLGLQPGQTVVDLACGPGDTGFLAAELVKPGGTLIATDGSRAMLGVATGRARDLGVTNVEFKQMELEWIDLPAASIDAILCRWGLMFAIDPAAALQEARRVLRPGGRIALAVWDDPELNPWATLTMRALVELGHVVPPDRNEPGMFALADAVRLRRLLEDAGFLEVFVDSVELSRSEPSLDRYFEETLDLSRQFADVWERLSERHQQDVRARVAELAQPFTADDESVRFPACSLVAAASA